MAGALLACGIMKALARECFENQYDKQRIENAERMEHIACELLDQYNTESEEYAFHALMHDVPALGARNCLDLAKSAGAIKFATRAAFESLVDKLWYGGIQGPSNRRWLVLFSLLFFPFLYFKMEIVDLRKYFKNIVCIPCF